MRCEPRLSLLRKSNRRALLQPPHDVWLEHQTLLVNDRMFVGEPGRFLPRRRFPHKPRTHR